MSHIITITASPTDSSDSDDYEYTISGTCDHRCEAWRECLNDKHRHPRNDSGQYGGDWSTKRTPEPHQWIDGTWCVRNPNTCGLYLAFEDGDPFDSAANDSGYAPAGVYNVEVDWDGDWWHAYLTPVPETGDDQ